MEHPWACCTRAAQDIQTTVDMWLCCKRKGEKQLCLLDALEQVFAVAVRQRTRSLLSSRNQRLRGWDFSTQINWGLGYILGGSTVWTKWWCWRKTGGLNRSQKINLEIRRFKYCRSDGLNEWGLPTGAVGTKKTSIPGTAVSLRKELHPVLSCDTLGLNLTAREVHSNSLLLE